MSAERDLAEAIHHEILSARSITDALAVWRYEADEPSERQRMWLTLEHVAAAAVDAVLARRQHEAARTGPWEGPPVAGTNPGDTPASSNGMWGDYQEEDGYPGSLVPRKRGAP